MDAIGAAVTVLPSVVAAAVGLADLLDAWPTVARAARFLAGAIAVVVVGWYVVEPLLSRTVRQRNPNNPTLNEAISRYLRLFVIAVAAFVGAGAAGYGRVLNDSALVIAAATLALGIAGQTVIGSLVSGLALVVDPEFNVGNYIEWSDGEGEVESITLRVTRVRTLDGALVTVPNTKLTNDEITRPYSDDRCRAVERVGLAYEDDIDAAIEHLTAAARNRDGVLADPAPSAYVDEFGSDAVVVRVHYWIDDPRERDIHAVRSAYARAAKDRLERAGITISPPSKRQLQGRIDVDGTA